MFFPGISEWLKRIAENDWYVMVLQTDSWTGLSPLVLFSPAPCGGGREEFTNAIPFLEIHLQEAT